MDRPAGGFPIARSSTIRTGRSTSSRTTARPAGTHEVKAWAERTKRVHFHFIPTSSSWLNLVERFFDTLTRKQIRRGVFHSVAHLESCLKQYIDTCNENPRPFVWTKSAAEILAKVDRARKALAAVSA